MKNLTDKEKSKVDKKIMDIVLFHLKALDMEETKENIKLAMTMFIEGITYWKEETSKEEK